MTFTRRFILKLLAVLPFLRGSILLRAADATPRRPFGAEFPNLDSLAVGEWWNVTPPRQNPPPSMDVSRDQVVAFALYTHDARVLKLTAQLYPLKPDESRAVRLEFQREGQWREAARSDVVLPGWSAHFRVNDWDASSDVAYRVRHGEEALFEGLIRRDPVEKEEIVVSRAGQQFADR
jgi:hypothetical protein